tara:strand:+ start:45 stop:566 length:522 start_codon:yes stop_codon:yes gene_type:complete
MKKSQISLLPVILGLIIIWLVYQLHLQSNQQDSLYETIQPSVVVLEIDSDDDDEPYRDDIYRRPVRHPPFNYPTRGPPGEYDRVGFLQDPDDPNKLQELFGRPTYPNSNNWNYFVKSDQYHQIPIPVTMNGKNCTDETGCTELNNQDSINLFDKQHTATIYKPEPYYYNPYVV